MADYKFDYEYAQTWLKLAKRDLDSAEMGLRGHYRPERSCFYARQVVEGAIKSVLIALEIPIPSLCDIRILLAKLPPTTIPPPPHADRLGLLELFAAIPDYAEPLPAAKPEEAARAVAAAADVLGWATTIVAGLAKEDGATVRPITSASTAPH
jgi:HEPN domain-containing protein